MTAMTPGSLIDGFRLEEKLYQGGMAELWRVARADISYPIVMKVPRLDYGDDPAAAFTAGVHMRVILQFDLALLRKQAAEPGGA